MFNRRAPDPGSKPHAVASAAQENEPLEREETPERVGHPEEARGRGEAFAARLGSIAIGIHGDGLREDRGGGGLAQGDLGQDPGGRGRVGHLAAGTSLHVGAEAFRPGVKRGVRRDALAVEVGPSDLAKRTVPAQVLRDNVADHRESKGLARKNVTGQDAAAMAAPAGGQGQSKEACHHGEKTGPHREPSGRPAEKPDRPSAADPGHRNEGTAVPTDRDPLAPAAPRRYRRSRVP